MSSVDIVSYPLAPCQGVPPGVDCGTQPRSGSIGRVAGNLLFTPHIPVPPTVPRSCIARKRRNGLGLVVHPRNGSSMCRVALFLPRIVAQSNLQRNGSPLLRMYVPGWQRYASRIVVGDCHPRCRRFRPAATRLCQPEICIPLLTVTIWRFVLTAIICHNTCSKPLSA